MKKRMIIVLLAIIVSACKTADRPRESAILLYNINIIDVTDGTIASDRSILIENDQIKSIDDYHNLKEKVYPKNQINCSNKYIIPGLWDAHVHIDKLANDSLHVQSMLSLYTLNGVTSIREMGGDWNKIKTIKEHSQKYRVSPTIYTAGPIFENKEFVDWVVEADNDIEFKQQRISVSNEHEVPELIDSVVQLGVDFIKVRTVASPEVFFKIAEETRKHHIKFCGHVDAKVDLYEAVESGISSLEHLDIFQLTGMTESKMDSVVSLMKSMNTSYCPTLTYFKEHRIKNKAKIKAYLNDSLNTHFKARSYASSSLIKKSNLAIEQAENSQVPWKAMESHFLKFGKKIAQNNVSIIAGTDGANALVLPGFSLHEELKLYQTQFGMSNLKILQTATINPARYFEHNQLGLIKAGYIADLVILDGNPLEDIGNISKIHSVIKAGVLIPKEEIETRLDNIRYENTRVN